MGFYECIHNCGDGCYCVSIGSSLDSFQSTDWVLCKKHKNIEIGSKFQYCFRTFYFKFKKNGEYPDDDLIRDVEVVDMKDFKIRNGTITIIRFKTELDCSDLDKSKMINFSMFDEDVTSWSKDNNIITLQFITNDIHRPQYTGNELYYNWNGSVCKIEEINK